MNNSMKKIHKRLTSELSSIYVWFQYFTYSKFSTNYMNRKATSHNIWKLFLPSLDNKQPKCDCVLFSWILNGPAINIALIISSLQSQTSANNPVAELIWECSAIGWQNITKVPNGIMTFQWILSWYWTKINPNNKRKRGIDCITTSTRPGGDYSIKKNVYLN